LQQRDSFLAGEITAAEPAVLTLAEVCSESPLPDYLDAGENAGHLVIGVDAIWQSYYRYAYEQACRHRSGFLKQWLAYEVSLRNALVELRAKQLELDAVLYLVAPELRDDDFDFTALLAEWSSCRDPLAGLQVLEQARWQWLQTHENWFAFNNDELAVYATKMLALLRWHRLIKSPVEAPAPASVRR